MITETSCLICLAVLIAIGAITLVVWGIIMRKMKERRLAKKSFLPKTLKSTDALLIIVVFCVAIVFLVIAILSSLPGRGPGTYQGFGLLPEFNGCTYHTIPGYCQCRGMVYDEDSGNCVTQDGKYWCSFTAGNNAIYERECGCDG